MKKLHSPAENTAAHKSQNQLRIHGRAARAGLNRFERAFAAEKIADNVIQSSWFQRSKHIGCYLSIDDEVDTWRIIARALRMKKRIFAPVIKKTDRLLFQELDSESTLCRNHYGLYEPEDGEIIAAHELDVVITPLVSFDASNHRVGMGGGYFDRTFAFLRHRRSLFHPKLVGVAFACQEVEKITPNPWDIRLFQVITEESAK